MRVNFASPARLIAAAFIVSLLLWSSTAHAQDSGSFVDGPPEPGISFAIYTGGPADGLPLAAPDAASFWVTFEGQFIGYLAGSPAFVNQVFVDHFASGGIPANTPMIVLTPEHIADPDPTANAGWSPPLTIQQPVIAAAGGGAAYDRDEWQHWIDADGDCQNARAEVLVAESTVAVTFTSASSDCTVATGRWLGPFTGQTFTAASDVDVDHMVPLKNAHDSGGSAWSAARKRGYANDLSDPQHLIAVDDGTNQSKGARGPEAWKPPLQPYWCQYAVDWISIKVHWDLTVTADEWSALLAMLGTCPGGSPTVTPSAVPMP